MPWTGGEAYTHGDSLWNDRRVAAVKIRQYWRWNNSALYSRSPDIRPPKSRETRPVCRFTVATPPPCRDVLKPTKRDPRACSRQQYDGGTNSVTLHSVDQRVTWYPPWTRGGEGGVGYRLNAPTLWTPCPTYPGGHPHACARVCGWEGEGMKRQLSWLPMNKQTMCVSVVDDDYITTALGRPIGSSPEWVPGISRELTTLINNMSLLMKVSENCNNLFVLTEWISVAHTWPFQDTRLNYCRLLF